MAGYKHYIRTNEAGIIVRGFSTAFEQPQDGDILIAEDAPRGFHEAFVEPLFNDRRQYRFKWDGEIGERSQQELDDEWALRPSEPLSPQERIERIKDELLQSKLDQAQANAELFEMMLMLTGAGGAV